VRDVESAAGSLSQGKSSGVTVRVAIGCTATGLTHCVGVLRRPYQVSAGSGSKVTRGSRYTVPWTHVGELVASRLIEKK